MRNAEIRELLDQASIDLFARMVEEHQSAGSDRSRAFVRLDLFRGQSALSGPTTSFEVGDAGVLDDLTRVGLLSVTRPARDLNYRVTPQGVAFYRWLLQQRGEPIEQVAAVAVSLVDSRAFVTQCPGGAHHLEQAFAAMSSGDMTDQVVSTIGGHLRSALIDTVNETFGAGSKPEDAVSRIKEVLGNDDVSRQGKAALALIEYTAAVFSFDQRLTHARDEAGRDREPITLSEVKNACFLTAVACNQVALLADDSLNHDPPV